MRYLQQLLWAGVLAAGLWCGPAAPAVRAQEAAPAVPPPAGTVEPESRMTLKEIVSTGGALMYVLGGMAVVGVAMVLYFLVVLREGQIVPRRFQAELRELLGVGRLDDARAACFGNRSAVSRIALAAIEYAHNTEQADPGLLKDIIEGEGGREASMIQNQIQYLQDLAVIAPMVGLLGTVLGMLAAFNSVALDIARAKPVVLAAGVSQALITTAAGLIVGIPAMAAYAYFRGRSAKMVSSLENVSAELLTLLVRKRGP